MTLTKKAGLMGAIACALIAGQAVAADDVFINPEWANSAWYVGGNIGRSRANIDDVRLIRSLTANGAGLNSFTADEKDVGYKLYVGKQLNQYVAIEGGYVDLGKFGFSSTTVPTGTLNGQIKLQGLNLDVVGTLPLTERLSAIGRVGAQYASARDRFSGTGAVNVLDPNPSKRAFNYKLGAGLQYEISRSLLVRTEVERYRVNDAVGNHGGVNLFSVSLVIPFGRAAEAAPRVMAAPSYVEAAPVPVPAPPAPPVVAAATPVAPVAVPPERRRVSFSADSLFGFDQSLVKPEGRAALDRFTKELAGTRFEIINVEGHTDRLGSPGYNQRLSTRRAEAVKAYLVSSGGVDAGKVSATGKGSSTPVTRSGDCKGNKVSPTLIACLQPDRRVEVETTGTR